MSRDRVAPPEARAKAVVDALTDAGRLAPGALDAIEAYVAEVKDGRYPAKEHCFS